MAVLTFLHESDVFVVVLEIMADHHVDSIGRSFGNGGKDRRDKKKGKAKGNHRGRNYQQVGFY
jgi:hypothetical protein